MPNVQTLTNEEIVAAANKSRDAKHILNLTEENSKNHNKALADLAVGLFEDSLSSDDDKIEAVTNYKVACTTEVDGKAQPDGVVIQIQMRISSSELDPADAGELQSLMGEKNFDKLFETRTVFDKITDLGEFLKGVDAKTIEKAAKIGKSGDLTIKVAEAVPGMPGVDTREAVFPKSSFLDKLAKLPKGSLDTSRSKIEEFIQEALNPTVVVGNRPEPKK